MPLRETPEIAEKTSDRFEQQSNSNEDAVLRKLGYQQGDNISYPNILWNTETLKNWSGPLVF